LVGSIDISSKAVDAYLRVVVTALGDYERPNFSSTDLFIANLTADEGFFIIMLLAGLICIFLR
jgi:hypothetical protein